MKSTDTGQLSDTSPQYAAELSDEELRLHPLFLDFANPEMHTSSNGLIVATNYLYRAEMLAYAILSSAHTSECINFTK